MSTERQRPKARDRQRPKARDRQRPKASENVLTSGNGEKQNRRILFQSRSFRKIPNRLFEIYRAGGTREQMGDFLFNKVFNIRTVIILQMI